MLNCRKHITWNHCPLGRAGFIQAAKNRAMKDSRGQATNMSTPWAMMRLLPSVETPISPRLVAGLYISLLMVGVPMSWKANSEALASAVLRLHHHYITTKHTMCLNYLSLWSCGQTADNSSCSKVSLRDMGQPLQFLY